MEKGNARRMKQTQTKLRKSRVVGRSDCEEVGLTGAVRRGKCAKEKVGTRMTSRRSR
jgi:hypothetical protein